MNIIGNKISESRKLKGLTQEELADLSKVNLRTIQRIENNENEPRGNTLNLICNALDLDLKDLLKERKITKTKNYGDLIINSIFLLIFNIVLMCIFGYLILDNNANLNSWFGGLLLSVFIPLFIVLKTQKMNKIERMLKFGSGFIFYILFIIFKNGFPYGHATPLFICLIIALGVLFYGKVLLNEKE